MIIVSVMLSQYNSLSIFNSIVSILGVICVHIFGNLYNDYFDVKSGTDENNNEYFNVGDKSLILRGAQISGGSRAIELGYNFKKHKKLGTFMIASALICVIILSINIFLQTGSLNNIYAIIIIGLVGSLLAYFYTAEPLRLSARKGLGELTIFLTFGPLLTLGSFFAMSNSEVAINFEAFKLFLLIGIPLGLLTTNILFINQYPDYKSDKKSDKINLVVLFGKKMSRWIYFLNLILILISTYYFFDSFSKSLNNPNITGFYIILSFNSLWIIYFPWFI